MTSKNRIAVVWSKRDIKDGEDLYADYNEIEDISLESLKFLSDAHSTHATRYATSTS